MRTGNCELCGQATSFELSSRQTCDLKAAGKPCATTGMTAQNAKDSQSSLPQSDRPATRASFEQPAFLSARNRGGSDSSELTGPACKASLRLPRVDTFHQQAAARDSRSTSAGTSGDASLPDIETPMTSRQTHDSRTHSQCVKQADQCRADGLIPIPRDGCLVFGAAASRLREMAAGTGSGRAFSRNETL